MPHIDLAGMFMLGLLGTGHCIGMCGPLVFALPGRSGRFGSHLWYHLGRVATYVAIGALLGGAGEALQRLAGLEAGSGTAGLQAGLRLVSAALLIVFGLNRLGWLPEPRWWEKMDPGRLPGFRAALGEAAGARRQAAFFALGLLLGLLPCGLSYGAFAQALGTGSAAAGALLVLLFAAGTLPGLLLLGTGVAAFVKRFRRPSDIIAGVLMLAMALKLVLKAAKAF